MRFTRRVASVLVITGILVTAAVALLGTSLAIEPRRPPSNSSGAPEQSTITLKPDTKGSLPSTNAEGRARADVDELEREEQEIGTLIRESQSLGDSARQQLIWPLPEDPQISSPFGMRQHPILNAQALHAGIDIVAKEGTPIRACGRGKVIAVTRLTAYGTIAIIDHGGKQATVYAHLSAVNVTEGQAVRKGETIGKVGRTGRVTGSHLHLEVRVNGDPVNPLKYLQPPK